MEADGVLIVGFNFAYIQVPVLARYELPWRWPAGKEERPLLAGYLIAGPGLSFLLSAEDAEDGRTLPRSDLSSVDVGFMGGLGLIWNVTPRLAASLELRFERGFVNVFATDVEAKNRAILLSLGIDYALANGGDGDRDGDGVRDSVDQCPTTREDRNGYRDSDGCPDQDEDDDKDGIVAGRDRCPEMAEDADEFDDGDGCPDDDNDDDRIVDAEDRCPNDAFPHNKALDHDRRGCPPPFTRVRAESDRLVLDRPLTFDVGKAELNAESKQTLDLVAELLTLYYPDMWLRLEGHADPTGGFTRNLQLSTQRAEAVKTYLEAKGIRDRLSTKTIGADRPEYFDQRKNRRVDLVIVQKP